MIQTERLSIRRVQFDDWRAIQAIWEDAAKSVYAQYDTPNALDHLSVSRRIAKWASFADSDEHLFFAVCKQDAVIGYISLHRMENSYEIGYCFHSSYHGKGYAKESISAMWDFMKAKGVSRMTAGTALNNTPSVKLLESLGFRQIGTETVSFYKDVHGNPITFDGGIYEIIRPIQNGGNTMCSRQEILSDFYQRFDEGARLQSTRSGQLEYLTTMAYIRRYASPSAKVLEIGAGTGRYSIALAEEGMDVTAVELVESNLRLLRERSRGIENLRSCQGDAADLSRFADDTFDVTLVLGPMYHLYDADEIHRAIDEAIRVTKTNGVLLFAFLSISAVMYADYFQGNWRSGQQMNFTEELQVRHFPEQLFTGYDISEFEGLFQQKPVEWITTAGVDGLLELIEKRGDFAMSDEDFKAFAAWYQAFSEKRELLGSTNHLLYICRKRP